MRRARQTGVVLSGGGREVLTALQHSEGTQRDMLGSAPRWDTKEWHTAAPGEDETRHWEASFYREGSQTLE